MMFQAVKLESQRANRTRYLVIASRCCCRLLTTEKRHRIIRRNSTRSSTTSNPAINSIGANNANNNNNSNTNINNNNGSGQQKSNVIAPNLNNYARNQPPNSKGDEEINSNVILDPCNMQSMEENKKTNLDIPDNMNIGSTNINNNNTSNTNNNNNNIIQSDITNGPEESCLLGIDCNENTTIGLVVPILADTTIHLDGDGYVQNYIYNVFILEIYK